jgi:hypothetical protein
MSQHCIACGRQTLEPGSSRVLHGNPYTPASDTEIGTSCTCGSCGAHEEVTS